MPKWDSAQYLKFNKERTQPSIDLCSRIAGIKAERILDLGCGPGNSTDVLGKAFPDSRIVGADSSPEMIASAKDKYPQYDFEIFDATGDFSQLGKFDIIFSNACLQWVPEHKKLLGKMMSALNDGGTMAVQIPMNFNEPIHKIIGELSSSDEWRERLHFSRIFYTLRPEEYYDILADISSDFSIWETVYCHRMRSHQDIIEWYRGTGLRPYLQSLDEISAKEFESQVYERVKQEYPVQKNGEIIFRFPRFFFTAQK